MARKIIRAMSKSIPPGGEDVIDLGPVEREVAVRLWDAPAKKKGATLRPDHVVEASNGIQESEALAKLEAEKQTGLDNVLVYWYIELHEGAPTKLSLPAR